MRAILDIQALVSCKEETNSYDLYIAISSDTLLIIDKQLDLVESIIHGNDVDGLYCSFDDEDDFLDSIILFKKMILDGINPKTYFL